MRKEKKELKWEVISNDYSEQARTYKNKYLEIEEEYGNDIILSVYKLQNDLYAIFIDYYKNISGIIYASKEDAYKIKEEIKKELENDFRKSGKKNNEFSNYFKKKYNVREIPEDFFDEDYKNEVINFNSKEIRCVSNTRNNKIRFLIPLISLIILTLFSFILTSIYSENKMSIGRFLYYSYTGDIITILIGTLLIILYVIWFLRIKNFELLIKGKKIFYKNIFGIKYEYDISQIKYYKIIENSGYYDANHFKSGSSTTILLYLNRKKICLFTNDSNLFELKNYLEHNKIVQIK